MIGTQYTQLSFWTIAIHEWRTAQEAGV